MNDNEDKNVLEMKINTWKKGENGIFYYKNDLNLEQIITVSKRIKDKDTYLIRKDDDITKANDNLSCSLNKNNEIICRIRKSIKNKYYEIINPIRIGIKLYEKDYNLNYLNNKIWYVVKSSKSLKNQMFEENNEDYILNLNDIIKLGRKIYIVIKKHINIENKNTEIKNKNLYNISNINNLSKSIFNLNIRSDQYKINQNEKNNKKMNYNNKENDDKIQQNNYNKSTHNCSKITDENKEINNKTNENKILLINENINENHIICKLYEKCKKNYSEENNPLIRLCKCDNFIHFNCLKSYLSSKLNIQYNLKKTVTTYICTKFNCDICHTPYPLRFKIPKLDKIYELIDLNIPEESNYIVLESLDYIKDNNNIKIIHVIELLDEEITIGRLPDNGIIDNDISVSRYHAALKYNKENGNLILENRSEKFGTLVLVRGNVKLNEDEINFQIGSHLITTNITSTCANS